jgi:hypothetical protein
LARPEAHRPLNSLPSAELIPLSVGSDDPEADGSLAAVAAELEGCGGVPLEVVKRGDRIAFAVIVLEDGLAVQEDESAGGGHFGVPEADGRQSADSLR